MKKDLKFINISDIHLGNSRNTTDYILESLYIFFNELKKRTDIDGIFFNGDLFDGPLNFSDKECQDIVLFFGYILLWCCKNNIKVRVLKGTPSHDWNQNQWFTTIAELLQIPVDIRYIDTLSIEYFSDWDIHVLYIPDEWCPTTEMTYNQVRAIMADNNLAQVDAIMMHGQFDFQIPLHLNKIPRHISELYQSLVKYYISVGHIHTFSFLDNIIAQGSFDRIAHNEEEAKGAVEWNLYTDGTKSFKFLENTHARIFKTIEIKTTDIEKTYRKIEKELKHIPVQSFVRLRLAKNHPLLAQFKELSVRYPLIHWSKISDDEKEVKSNTLFIENTFTRYQSLSITKDNITDLVEKRLTEKGLDTANIRKISEILGDTIKDL
jgi:DNA repair exonuclease SbcCD nuclease subunit